MIYELTNQMKAQTFTQIVTSNLGNLIMIHKIQLLQQLLKLTHNQLVTYMQNKSLAIYCGGCGYHINKIDLVYF